MDDHKLNLAIHALMPVRYTVKKRGYYYRPGGAGYTDRIEEAWKLSLSLSRRGQEARVPARRASHHPQGAYPRLLLPLAGCLEGD